MTTLRFGILATGNIARQFAQGVTAGARRSAITAVASRSLDKAQQFAQQYGIPAAYGDYQSLIDDPDIDAVYVATPNDSHMDLAIRAMQAGKHVLCEKPAAMDATQAARMFELSRQTGKVLIEAFMYRCHPQTQDVLSAIRSGRIGQVKLIRSSFCFNARHPETNTRFVRELGGGALMDIGCYCIDLAMLIAGVPATDMHAAGRLYKTGVDVSASGTLVFDRQITSTFTCAMDTQASNLAQVCGTEGYIDIPVPWKPPVENATWSIQGMTPPKQDGDKHGESFCEQHTANAGQPLYALEADAFARVVLDGEVPFVTERQTLDRMRVIDELRRQIGVTW